MNDEMLLKSLVEQVRTEARPEVVRVLRQLAHDINTPISTLTMDLFSVRLLVEQLQRANHPAHTKTLADLVEMCANLERASGRLADYASALSDLVFEPPEPADGALYSPDSKAVPRC